MFMRFVLILIALVSASQGRAADLVDALATALRPTEQGVELSGERVFGQFHFPRHEAQPQAAVSFRFDRLELRAGADAPLGEAFSESALDFGPMLESPVLSSSGPGQGVFASYDFGNTMFSGLAQYDATGGLFAAELALADDALALRTGRRGPFLSAADEWFAGGRLDLLSGRVDTSLRWHVGWSRVAGAVERGSRGAVAAVVPAPFWDSDSLSVAVARPFETGLGMPSPTVDLAYVFPLMLGELETTGRMETGATAEVARMNIYWNLTW